MITNNRLTFRVHELVFALIFMLTFTSYSIAEINVSDKIPVIFVAGLLFVKYIRFCVRFLINKCFMYLIFLVFGLLGVLFLDSKTRIMLFNMNYFLQIVMFAVFVYIFSTFNLSYEKFLDIIFKINVFMAIIGILQYFFWEPVTRFTSLFVDGLYKPLLNGKHRIASFYDNPNMFAGMMVCMSLVGILFWYETRIRKYLVGSAIMVVALLFTQTRSALLVLPLGVLHVFFLKWQGRQRQKKTFTLIAASTIGILYVISKGLLSRLLVVFSGTASLDVMTGKRNIVWGTLLRKGSEHIAYGIGNGMSEIVTVQELGPRYGPHSMYVGLLSETGLFGGVACLLFIISILMAGRKIKEKNLKHIFYVLYVAMLFLQISESHLRHFMQFIILFWLVASIPFAEELKKKKQEARRIGGMYH